MRPPLKSETRGTRRLWVNYGTSAAGLVGFAALIYALRRPPLTAMRVAGALLFVPSGVLVIMARLKLGRAFTVLARAEVLVTTGIYARIRNPIYVFGSVALLGVLLWIGKPWLSLILVPVVPMQVYRARNEERVLVARFGAAYEEYKRRTWF